MLFLQDVANAEENTDLLHKLSKWFPFKLPSINLAPIRTTPRPAPKVTAKPPPKAPAARPPAPAARPPSPAPKPAAPRPAPATAAPVPEPELTTAAAPEPEVTTGAAIVSDLSEEETTGASTGSDSNEEATSQSSNSENSETVSEIMDAVNKASSMDDLKNALLQMKDFASPMTAQQQAMLTKPLQEYPVLVQNAIAKLVEYLQKLNGKAPNFSDPIEVEMPAQ